MGAAQREWRQQQWAAVGLLVGSITAIVYGSRIGSPVWGFGGGLLACLALFWLLRLSGRKPSRELYALLADQPERVRWVYGERTQRLPFGLKLADTGTLYLVLDDGERLAFSLPSSKLKLVSKTLNRVLPEAEFGYTPARAAKYQGPPK
ncbi:MAG: hypothetical protein HC821_03095 [Lewinella sp.]|nr:hypothetical protein [Lewinella sp.]